MSIDTSHNIIPSNIRETLNQESGTVFVRQGKKRIDAPNTPADAPNTPADALKTFAAAHGNVLSSMQALSKTRYIKTRDMHFGNICSSLIHNLKALFNGDGSKERKILGKAVNNLEVFAKNGNKVLSFERKDFYQLYQAVKSAKYEHIKDNKDNKDNGSLQLAERMDTEREKLIEQMFDDLKKNILKKKQGNGVLSESINNGKFDLDAFVKNYGGNLEDRFGEDFIKTYKNYCFIRKTSFKDLALRTLSAVPGDKETLWAAYKNYVKLTNLVEEGGADRDAFICFMNPRFYEELGNEMMKFKGKTLEFENGELKFKNEDLKLVSDLKPQTLADRIEVALKMIAKNSGYPFCESETFNGNFDFF